MSYSVEEFRRQVENKEPRKNKDIESKDTVVLAVFLVIFVAAAIVWMALIYAVFTGNAYDAGYEDGRASAMVAQERGL